MVVGCSGSSLLLVVVVVVGVVEDCSRESCTFGAPSPAQTAAATT